LLKIGHYLQPKKLVWYKFSIALYYNYA
jgi:hypothetical protein